MMFIKAHDIDSGMNSQLTYALADSNQHKEFRLDPGKGELIVSGDLSSYVEEVFTLNVIVSDRGVPMRSTPVTLYVVVDKSVMFVELKSDIMREQATSSWLLPAVLAIIIGAIVVIIILLLVIVAVRHRHATKFSDVTVAASVEHKSIVNCSTVFNTEILIPRNCISFFIRSYCVIFND